MHIVMLLCGNIKEDKKMNAKEFNIKYSAYLEPRFYGLAIDVPEVVKFLDEQFAIEIENNPDFQYSQIKMKFTYPCVYTNSFMNETWATQIKIILSKDVMTDIIY